MEPAAPDDDAAAPPAAAVTDDSPDQAAWRALDAGSADPATRAALGAALLARGQPGLAAELLAPLAADPDPARSALAARAAAAARRPTVVAAGPPVPGCAGAAGLLARLAGALLAGALLGGLVAALPAGERAVVERRVKRRLAAPTFAERRDAWVWLSRHRALLDAPAPELLDPRTFREEADALEAVEWLARAPQREGWPHASGFEPVVVSGLEHESAAVRAATVRLLLGAPGLRGRLGAPEWTRVVEAARTRPELARDLLAAARLRLDDRSEEAVRRAVAGVIAGCVEQLRAQPASREAALEAADLSIGAPGANAELLVAAQRRGKLEGDRLRLAVRRAVDLDVAGAQLLRLWEADEDPVRRLAVVRALTPGVIHAQQTRAAIEGLLKQALADPALAEAALDAGLSAGHALALPPFLARVDDPLDPLGAQPVATAAGRLRPFSPAALHKVWAANEPPGGGLLTEAPVAPARSQQVLRHALEATRDGRKLLGLPPKGGR